MCVAMTERESLGAATRNQYNTRQPNGGSHAWWNLKDTGGGESETQGGLTCI